MSGLDATLDINVDTTDNGTNAQAALRATPAGAWTIVESGARPHTQRRRRGMPTTYAVYSKVAHPGTAGQGVRQPATTAADQAADLAATTAVDALPHD